VCVSTGEGIIVARAARRHFALNILRGKLRKYTSQPARLAKYTSHFCDFPKYTSSPVLQGPPLKIMLLACTNDSQTLYLPCLHQAHHRFTRTGRLTASGSSNKHVKLMPSINCLSTKLFTPTKGATQSNAKSLNALRVFTVPPLAVPPFIVSQDLNTCFGLNHIGHAQADKIHCKAYC
jgi:hypothetical protein